MIEHKATYKNYDYVIIFDTDMGYRCGYVGLPEGHKYYKVYYGNIPKLPCHGGLTFSDFSTKLGENLWWIGYDCNHCDGLDVESLLKYNNKTIDEFSYLKTYMDMVKYKHIYTLEECIDMCIGMIDKLIYLETNDEEDNDDE